VPEKFVELIAFLRNRLKKYETVWNEMELQYHFIGPLLSTIDFDSNSYSGFAQRKLAIDSPALKVEGVIDFLVASGQFEPEKPYFFLHEYKRFKSSKGDPLGQLLISMIAAQYLNNDGLPIYGCFVVGKIWSFVVLAGKEYATSQIYDATNEEDLHFIWNILQHTKIIIEERVQTKQCKRQLQCL
jgi:hypothetical protein